MHVCVLEYFVFELQVFSLELFFCINSSNIRLHIYTVTHTSIHKHTIQNSQSSNDKKDEIIKLKIINLYIWFIGQLDENWLINDVGDLEKNPTKIHRTHTRTQNDVYDDDDTN